MHFAVALMFIIKAIIFTLWVILICITVFVVIEKALSRRADDKIGAYDKPHRPAQKRNR